MKLIVKTLHGVEELLANELGELGAVAIAPERRAVVCEADMRTLYRICLESRFALRVLIEVVKCNPKNDKELYAAVHSFPWHEYISPDHLLYIDHITFSSIWNNSKFLAMKAKDAIVDEINEVCGRRPSISSENFDILLNIHASDEEISLALDASRTTLNRRGYRTSQPQQATNEVLAAALVELSGWTDDMPLYDPMCGVGTICIEAAMKARHIPANYYRKEPFGFALWKNFDEALWQEVRGEAESKITNQRLTIIGSDVNSELLDIYKSSSLLMNLTPDVRCIKQSLKEATRQTSEGVVITCPPVNDDEAPRQGIEEYYKEITYYLSHNFPDHDVWVFSTNMKAMRAIPYKSDKRLKVYSNNNEGNFNLYPF
ncbi:MAG: hypothetical protein HUJ96_08925 [Marinilabiliaceae bacterium]|nr:hypothetical protein [Marinilabiliaceae bacterium]